MGFLGVYRAIYDYIPQAAGELTLDDGDLLYVIEKNDEDGWWKAKKKAGIDDEDEPVGLVPNNYVEQAPPQSRARAIYEYTRQTDEELSFSEDAVLDVFDTSDPDWILVGLDTDYGFVPSNYIEMQTDAVADESSHSDAPPSLPTRPQSSREAPSSPQDDPAATLAGIMQGRAANRPASPTEPTVYGNEHVSDDESARSPALPSRPLRRPTADHVPHGVVADDVVADDSSAAHQRRTPGGFHMYNINEMLSVMGKKKKMPTTLGVNLGTGTILIAPERAQDDPAQEWTADKMTHYSREGKHVFIELVRPSKSVDFHAGAKDTAEEIVAALGELAGAVRAEGLRDAIMARPSQNNRKGQVLYDFMAQGDDEVTVGAGDEVLVVDDSKSDEWWQVRRLKNGKEGVVPSSYIEVTGTVATMPHATMDSGLGSARSTVEQNRLEEVRLTKEAIKASKEPQQVGPGVPLPERGSSLLARENNDNLETQRSRRESGRSQGDSQSKSKSKPDAVKIRTWTDRSRSFSVEAQFLGLKDGKIHLHKMNGVKIAVPIAKMSRNDLEYVETTTGISLDDERPLADIKRSKSLEKKASEAGATVEKTRGKEYDWFQFFLSCDVAVGLCERYAQAFLKDSMDESVLRDVDAPILRTLGLREGDIIKVMRTLDTKFGRDRSGKSANGNGGPGGLFSGPGGTLRNNTRKGRPAPTVQTDDTVDASAFSKKDTPESGDDRVKAPLRESPASSPSATGAGFDDDAWDLRPKRQQGKPGETSVKESTETAPQIAPPMLTGSMKELSLLTPALQPTKAELQPQGSGANSGPDTPHISPPGTGSPPSQRPGASPSFFAAAPQSQQSASTGRATGAPLGDVMPPNSMAQQRLAPNSASPVHGSVLSPPSRSTASAIAPPGQSLNDISQAHYAAHMQQLQQQQPTMTGYAGLQQHNMMSQPPAHHGQFMQPMMTGTAGSLPFGAPGRPTQFSPIQGQHTGFNPTFTHPQTSYNHPSSGGINSYLPPALEPQQTGILGTQSHQATGMGGFTSNPTPQPLQPQKTGPPPPVRFGVPDDSVKLMPQQTGRRANLAQATPQNPFGF